MDVRKGDITSLLLQWKEGDDQAMERLMPLIYNQLHAIAANCLKRGPNHHDLSVTDLLHEVWFQVRGRRHVDWQDRNHFFADAARITRYFVIRHYKERNAQKRGGGRVVLTLPDPEGIVGAIHPDWPLLDDALVALEESYRESAHIVDLFYFVGLKQDEMAEVLGTSRATIKRELEFSRAWLRTYMKGRSP
ncbi:MAG: ECF-type sigma factor [Acidobacteriota bacterium]|nr:ECF-type sigma factor [Acidobacteriota bacterium]